MQLLPRIKHLSLLVALLFLLTIEIAHAQVASMYIEDLRGMPMPSSISQRMPKGGASRYFGQFGLHSTGPDFLLHIYDNRTGVTRKGEYHYVGDIFQAAQKS